MRIGEQHKAYAGVTGKCSVPMFSCGGPDGFCDRPAFGQQYATRRHAPAWFYAPGHVKPYAPALCCDQHGGPSETTIRFVRDGNMWCAFMPGFVNLQESDAGFGPTQDAAEDDLKAHVARQAISNASVGEG